MYNRFTIQILCTADGTDSIELHTAIKSALEGIDKVRVKAVNLDMWVNGFSGEPRTFDEHGKEIVEVATPEQLPTETEVVEE